MDRNASPGGLAASLFYMARTEKGGPALVGLPDCESPTFFGQTDAAVILQFQPTASNGVHHRLRRSSRKAGQPTRRQRTTIRRKIDGQKHVSSEGVGPRLERIARGDQGGRIASHEIALPVSAL